MLKEKIKHPTSLLGLGLADICEALIAEMQKNDGIDNVWSEASKIATHAHVTFYTDEGDFACPSTDYRRK
jgi:hypothetical protein